MAGCLQRPHYVGHIQSHSSLPRPSAEGKAQPMHDILLCAALQSVLIKAHESHALYHQNIPL